MAKNEAIIKKLEAKTSGRPAMREFLKSIIEYERMHAYYKNKYRDEIQKAVKKEENP